MSGGCERPLWQDTGRLRAPISPPWPDDSTAWTNGFGQPQRESGPPRIAWCIPSLTRGKRHAVRRRLSRRDVVRVCSAFLAGVLLRGQWSEPSLSTGNRRRMPKKHSATECSMRPSASELLEDLPTGRGMRVRTDMDAYLHQRGFRYCAWGGTSRRRCIRDPRSRGPTSTLQWARGRRSAVHCAQ